MERLYIGYLGVMLYALPLCFWLSFNLGCGRLARQRYLLD